MMEATRNKSESDIENEAKMLKASPRTSESSELAVDYSRIVDSMREISAELNPKKAAKIITEQVCKLLQCEKAILYTYDAESDKLMVNSEESLQDKEFPANTGIIDRVIHARQSKIINDVDLDIDLSKEKNVLSVLLCFPLSCFGS